MSDQHPPSGGTPPPGQWPPPGGPGGPGGPGYGGGPQYGGPPYGAPYPYGYGRPQQDAPGATTALVLGILGLVLCQFIAPFAWYYGNRALEEIEMSGRTLGGHGSAKAGQVLGIIGTILMVLVIVYFVFVIAMIASSSST